MLDLLMGPDVTFSGRFRCSPTIITLISKKKARVKLILLLDTITLRVSVCVCGGGGGRFSLFGFSGGFSRLYICGGLQSLKLIKI